LFFAKDLWFFMGGCLPGGARLVEVAAKTCDLLWWARAARFAGFAISRETYGFLWVPGAGGNTGSLADSRKI
jgi:hypothetical protein